MREAIVNNEIMVRLEKAAARHAELERLMGDPQVVTNRGEYQRYAKEYAELGRMVERFRRYKNLLKATEESRALLQEDGPGGGGRPERTAGAHRAGAYPRPLA
jgi:peptide chain release factor 1